MPLRLGRQDALNAGLLLLACAAFFWPLLSLDAIYWQDDFTSAIYPYFNWLHQHYRSGTLPEVQASLFAGIPRFDEGSTGLLYPPFRLVLAAFEPARALAVLYALHFAWAMGGLYLLARSGGVGPTAALLSSLAVGLGGGMVFAQRSWITLVSQAWFPWAMVGLILCARPGWRRRGAAVLGLAQAFALLGGHPGSVIIQTLALTVVALILALRTGPGERVPYGAALAGAALLAGLAFAGPAAGMARLASQSERGAGLTLSQAAENSLSPATLAQPLLPHALGRLGDNSFLGASWRLGTHVPQGMLLYVGILGALMALLGLFERPRDSLPYLAATGLIILYALGDWTPAFRVLHSLPVLSHLRAPMRAAGLAGMLLALPMAWGAERMVQGRAPWAPRLLLGLSIALALAALALGLAEGRLLEQGAVYIQAKLAHSPIHHYPPEYYLGKLARLSAGLRSHLAWQAALAALSAVALAWALRKGGASRAAWPAVAAVLAFELVWQGRAFLPRAEPALLTEPPATAAFLKERLEREGPGRAWAWGWTTQYKLAFPNGRADGDGQGERALAELLQPNANAAWEIPFLNGYSSALPRRLAPYLSWTDPFRPDLDPSTETRRLLERRRLLDVAGVRYLVSALPLEAPGFKAVRPGRPIIYRNERALPLAYLASHAASVAGPEAAAARLVDPADPASSWPAPALLEAASPTVALAPGTVRVARQAEGAWDLEVGASGDAVLVVSQLYYPGWTAQVNGRSAPLMPCNGAFLALRLGAGQHRVELRWDDPLPAWSVAGALLALALAAWAWFGARRSPR